MCVYDYIIVSRHKMGRHIVFCAPLSVNLSVCSSVCLSSRFRVRSISFEHLGGYTKKRRTHVKFDESMCIAYVWPSSVQGQSSRLNIVWLYFVSALYILSLVGFTNNSAQMSNMISLCAVRMFDQGVFKVKVYRACCISFKSLVGFTNNFAQSLFEVIVQV